MERSPLRSIDPHHPLSGERQKVGGQGKSAQAEVMADPIPFKRLTLEQFYAT